MFVPPRWLRCRLSVVLGGLVIVQAGLLGWSAYRHSPTFDEPGHLVAGLHHWQTGTFDLYRVNPPLVRFLAAAPLALAGVELENAAVWTGPPDRPEFELGIEFVDRHGTTAFWYCTVARWACIPFALLATVVIHLWGSALYGRGAGLLSATLWVICPNVLGHGSLLTPDIGAAAVGVCACGLFWLWLRRPGWAAATAAGAALGLAELCKTTWVVLPPTWVVGWLLYRYRNPAQGFAGWWGQAAQLLGAFVTGLFFLNVGYGFEGIGTRLGAFHFHSHILTYEDTDGYRVNRFAGGPMADLPVLLPRNYLEGIDVQKRDFERHFTSYLRGESRAGGWWYYYLYGLLVKTPVGTIVLFVLAVVSFFFRTAQSPGWRDEAVLLLPGLVVLGFVSSQTGFNHHLRYVLPALPCLFIWVGRVAAYAGPRVGWWRGVVVIAGAGAGAESLTVYPHSLSFFNLPAGGPLRGSDHLLDSNVDWGQDLLYLKQWMDDHQEARPIGLAYHGSFDPRATGHVFSTPPAHPWAVRPGWYAVSVCFLRGRSAQAISVTGKPNWTRRRDFGYLLRCRPVATAGYSIFIYHLDEADCERVHREYRDSLPQQPP